MKVTRWFDADVKPTHVGVYQVRASFDGAYEWANWNGSAWGWFQNTPKQAARYKGTSGAMQRKTWRGLAVKP